MREIPVVIYVGRNGMDELAMDANLGLFLIFAYGMFTLNGLFLES